MKLSFASSLTLVLLVMAQASMATVIPANELEGMPTLYRERSTVTVELQPTRSARWGYLLALNTAAIVRRVPHPES
ncbi:hypothetical protein FA95DRAFT_1563031 [Auriscalpium vulgare]|uniref:Uncharacterized protein n=1 Tax=Auriscalpium vulgare TaxID=40419 RepID=A0ACB8RJ92_9AGAM|nr:hypothetical protein FA95DRAFT_1563031 [Auriscalpium vulgare]